MSVLLVAAGAAAATIASGGTVAAPIGSAVKQDAVGDAGLSPDISSLAVTVSADQILTLALTFANRTSLAENESAQFFLTTLSGAALNLATFDNDETRLSVRSGSTWESVIDVGGTWSGSTFSVSVSLSTLSDAAHAPVEPALYVSAGSYVGPDGQTPTAVDAVPDTGSIPVATQASAAPTTTAPATTTSSQPTATPPASNPSGVTPYVDEKIERLSNHRLEWKRLIVQAVPSGSSVSMDCTKLCTLSERPHVAKGVAASKRFVGVPLARGATFLIRVVAKDGTGWWFRTTVVGQPAGQETTSGRGCIAKSGALVSLANC